MQVVHGHRDMPGWAGAAVAIGNFDGVHVGHRALVDRTRELAARHGARSVALTFDPHPSALLSSRGAPPPLASLARRLELLEAAGLDAVVVEPFTRELAALPPDAFIDQVLLGALRARALVVGYNFCYGHGRAGTAEVLQAHGARASVEVAVVPPVEIGGEVVSSSRIRNDLRAGDLASAARLLGRRWDVDGEVVHGAKRGRAIGVPTANVATSGDLPIAPGIYAVTLSVEPMGGGNPAGFAGRAGGNAPRGIDAVRPAVASLGTNPTFVDGGKLVLEVHVLDWDGDLYGRTVRTTFVARLRDELKFDGVDALIAQIRRDIADARRALGAT